MAAHLWGRHSKIVPLQIVHLRYGSQSINPTSICWVFSTSTDVNCLLVQIKHIWWVFLSWFQLKDMWHSYIVGYCWLTLNWKLHRNEHWNWGWSQIYCGILLVELNCKLYRNAHQSWGRSHREPHIIPYNNRKYPPHFCFFELTDIYKLFLLMFLYIYFCTFNLPYMYICSNFFVDNIELDIFLKSAFSISFNSLSHTYLGRAIAKFVILFCILYFLWFSYLCFIYSTLMWATLTFK